MEGIFFFLEGIFFFQWKEEIDKDEQMDLQKKIMEIKNGTKNRKNRKTKKRNEKKKQVVVTSSLNLQRQNCLDFFFFFFLKYVFWTERQTRL